MSDKSGTETKEANGRKVIANVTFGPHYYLEISQENGKVTFNLGATHHGFKVDASDVGKGLETVINCVRKNFPELSDYNGMTL